MMEVINNVFALIYIRKNVDDDGDVYDEDENVPDEGQTVKW